jgi:AcrR family transcriptional regulator
MDDKFVNLDQEKRERIINAAMSEFALRGYDRASTNEIVKEAKISKGLLFHYFKNKKQLFLFLFDYGIQVLSDEIFKKIDTKERKLFKLMNQTMKTKMDLLKKYENIYDFVQAAYLETSPEVREEIELRSMNSLSISMDAMFKNIDTSNFVEGLDLTKALNIIIWSNEGMVSGELKKCRLLNENVDYDRLFLKAEENLNLLEKLFYKGGYEK